VFIFLIKILFGALPNHLPELGALGYVGADTGHVCYFRPVHRFQNEKVASLYRVLRKAGVAGFIVVQQSRNHITGVL
jgi:hypothetical protein